MRRLSPPPPKVIKAILLFSLPIVIISALFIYDHYSTRNKIYPNIWIAGINVSGKSITDSTKTIENELKKTEEIVINTKEGQSKLKTSDINLSYDISASVQRAYNITRTGNFLHDFGKKIELRQTPNKLGLIVKYDTEKLDSYISVLAGQEIIEPVHPKIKLIKGHVEVEKGNAGEDIDQVKLKTAIGENLAFAKDTAINIPIVTINPSLTEDEVKIAKSRAEKYLGKTLNVKFESQIFTLNDEKLISLLIPKGGVSDEKIAEEIKLLADKIERPSQNPKFQFDGGRVTEFLPAKDGVKIKNEELRQAFVKTLEAIGKTDDKNHEINVPVELTQPAVTTDKINNLGIKEVIGTGSSTYFHSIPGRVHNVALASSRINGTLVAPDEVFSFNQVLGDVSKFTGYKEAYIISEGKTILGDGGGVCQVSTTLFRALLNAGLPIVERSPHAYRVGYYEQSSPPGLDATVYGPSPDLKFTNNTGNHILIQAIPNTKNYSLVVELYGTKDGRISKLTKPTITNVVPPPPDVFQDDPTLPAGTIKQVDYKAWGARVQFNYEVERNGEIIFQKTFTSNYRPWQAIFLKGTGGV